MSDDTINVDTPIDPTPIEPIPPKKRTRKTRGRSSFFVTPVILYVERNPLYQRAVDVLGLPGSRAGQQVELRHYIALGHDRAIELVRAWVEELDELNPTMEDRKKIRGFQEPGPIIAEDNDSQVQVRYGIYFNRDTPAEQPICAFLETEVFALVHTYRRQRLPKKLRQYYLRTALVEGMKQNRSISTWTMQ